jgi:hypothetical protein
MNKKIWKLQQTNERMWVLAPISAMLAVELGSDGRGIAVIAEEVRILVNYMNTAIERVMFKNEEINVALIQDLAMQLNLLALNNAIESFSLGEKGRKAAVVAEEIRNLADETIRIINDDSSVHRHLPVAPWPKNPLTTVSKNNELISFDINGINILENLDNIEEVFHAGVILSHEGNRIKHRRGELTAVNGFKLMGETENKPLYYIVLRTPWVEQSKTLAVAVSDVHCLHVCPVGTPVEPPADMPLAAYVRECWESENGEPFYFMDWLKMV